MESNNKTPYQKMVERLALSKIEKEILFNGMVDSSLKRINESGNDISKSQLISDINKEIMIQCMHYDLDYGVEAKEPQSLDIKKQK